MALFDPDGDFLDASSGSLVGDLFANLVETGTYTVVVVDESSGEDAVGDYDLYFTLLPGANEGGGLSGGQTINDFIDLGDIDSYAFTADALGTSITITVSDLDLAGLFPRVVLFDPTGSFVAGESSDDVASINSILNQSGQYTVVVIDESSGEDAIGNYQISGVGAFTGVPSAGQLCNGFPITVDLGNFESATTGDDVILGTDSADLINALAGNDTICAGGGADIVNAGGGDDWVDGESGNDTVFGGGGVDIIFGGPGADTIDGGGGDDEIYGQGGDDVLNGRTGLDIIDGGDGVDDIRGGPSADIIYTGAGATVGVDQFVSGGGGGDTITGGPDADDIRGGGGLDIINAEQGDDVITGGAGRDEISGGPGNDEIRGQQSPDIIEGNAGNDTIFGGSGDDDMSGGSGTDTCNGQGNTVNGGDTAVGCETEFNVP